MEKMKPDWILNLLTVILVGVLAAGFAFVKCENSAAVEDSTVVVSQPVALDVEHITATDREEMFLEQADYRWFETSVVMADYFDGDGEQAILSVTNVFQFVTAVGDGYDTTAALVTHSADGSSERVTYDGFILGDNPLNEEEITLTLWEAYERMMASNFPKPHSRKVVLRRQVGPVACNPQYIFGNVVAQLYVDAATGEVSDKDPAFAGSGVAMPLGEWP